jgi:amino acid adenylation domain-containing protein
MSDLVARIAALAPEKQALLALRNPLSFAQQRLWFLDQFQPGQPVYTLAQAVRLEGTLDLPALTRSLNAIVARHASLRTTFLAVEGRPLQISGPAPSLPLALVNLSGLPAAAREQQAQQQIRAAAETSFDLARGPLWSVRLLRLAAAEHVLLLAMHHIISDAWSMRIFVEELSALYAAQRAGRPAALAELPIQYVDFAIWEREWLRGAALAAQLDYWKAALGDAPSVLELPTDRPRPAALTFRGDVQRFHVPAAPAEALKALGQREDVTLFMILLAAFQVVLARYSGQDRFIVGSFSANRQQDEVGGLIGFFVNTLALPADLSGQPTFRELLGRVRAVALGAYAHQALPFEKLVEELRPARDPGRSPLFQVAFVLQNVPPPAPALGDLILQPFVLHNETTKFDLMLDMTETPAGLSATLEYSTDLFDAATMGRLAGHVRALLEGVAADPRRRIAALPLVRAAERQQLLVEWNDTRRGVRGQGSGISRIVDACLHKLFEAQAARTPDAVAVVFDETKAERRRPKDDSAFSVRRSAFSVFQMTYRELNRRANQLAHHLRELGVGPDTLVALCADRSLEMLVGILGILKAGGAYVPLDPAYPPDRIAFMLEDSQAPVLVTQQSMYNSRFTIHDLGQSDAAIVHRTSKIVTLDTDWPAISARSSANPPATAAGEHLAYVIYTSGSTGRPKGVMVRQRGLLNLCAALRPLFADAAVQRTALITSISFDISVNQIFPTLLCGRTLHIIPDAVKYDSATLMRYVDQQAIQLMDAVPSYVQAVLRDLAPQRLSNSFRYLLIGGEKLEPSLLRAIFAQLGADVTIVNIYGLTEITDINAIARIPAAARDQLITVGRPLRDTQIYIVNTRGQMQPVGVVGELWIGGAGLARGYHQRPALTAERFVPNPFAAPEDERRTTNDETEQGPCVLRPASCVRLYKTGDLGRYRADGRIEVLGRLDQQVKLRGYRIELGEIEALLAVQAGVRAAAVIVREDRPDDRRLVAYVVPTDDYRSPTTDDRRPAIGDGMPFEPSSIVDRPSSLLNELRVFLKSRLPDYMIPAAFVLLAALPLTPNGKIDRNALPAPEYDEGGAAEGYVAPRTPVEELLAVAWAQVLGVERVGIHDNFFALGGHSLLATQVSSRLTNIFQRPLPVKALFDAPTPADLALYIEAARQQEAPDGLLPPLRPTATPGEQPLSFAQERLWFLDQLAPGNPTYNLPAALRLRGRLDVGALERGWREIVRRHASLRTSFAAVDGRPVQVVAPTIAGGWAQVDLRALPLSTREAVARRLIGGDVGRSFDLRAGSLWRALLVRLAETEYLALLTVHHIIADGWSLGLLVREVTTLYAAFAQGRPLRMPDPTLQYVDFALWQRAWLQGPARERQLAYWRSQLQGLAPLELPSDRPRPPVQTYHGATEALTFSPALTGALAALSRDESVTLYMTLLAAFQVLLYRYTGQADIAVGTPIAGRNHSEIEQLVGFFINTLVLRTQLHDEAGPLSFRALLRRVRQVCLDAYAHQDIPFEHLLEALQPERDLSRTPLFQIFFNMLNFSMAAVDLLDLTVAGEPLPEIGAKFDLTLQVQEQPDGLHLTAIYNTDLFEGARIRELLAQYQQLLAQVTEDAERSIAAYSLVTPSARLVLPDPTEALRNDWVGAVHQLFARQARRVPSRLAVVDTDERWTYADLERRSNQLAHALRAHGIQPQDVVAIYAHRSAALVWALLGILKAGAAFVVLDPALPAARLVDYLALAAPRALLQLAAAGPFPPDAEAYLAGLALRARFTLPACAGTEAQGLFADQPTGDPEVLVGADDLACIAFTSGSTGKPKGILGRHGPLTHFIPWVCRTFELGEDDRFSLLAGIAFDMLQREIFTALYLGATVCIPDPDQLGAPGWLANWMRREAISVVHLTPATGQLLTEGAAGELPALRRAFFIGEALTRWLVARLRRLASAAACINLYGLTEAQRAVSYFVITDEAAPGRETIPVGRGMPNLQLLIVNRAGQLAGVGEVGEIYFRTPHLARGYLADEALTRERFLTNPFTQRPEDRMYKTGDLGRYLPDGNVESLGRADLQVKRRGYRIELGEIEAALNAHPAVRESAVAARRLPRPPDAANQPEETLLVAYVVPTTDHRPPIEDEGRRTNGEGSDSSFALRPSSFVTELRSFLRQRLPEYMLPSAIVLLEAMPLAPHGKIDRAALPQADIQRSQVETAYVAPQTEVERAIASVWQAVLGVDQVGIHDNFFELGGHSLNMVRVQSKLQQRLDGDLSLTIADLFQYPTVGSLAAYLHGAHQPRSFEESHDRADTRRTFLEQQKQRRQRQRVATPPTGDDDDEG